MTETIQRDSMQYDVVIVGAGPAGLSAAIKLKQLAAAASREISVCVVEKASELGAHILSGAVIDPITLQELLPDWKERGAPLRVEVNQDKVFFFTEKHAIPLPVTSSFQNHGNYIISLGELVRWLGEQAESLGVEIYPGFAAAEVLYHEDGSVKGIATGNMGVGKDGQPTDNFQPGMELWAQQTLFAEGCRGSLSQQIIQRFALDKDCNAQTYGLGVKEIWEVEPDKHQQGLVVHSSGWPLDNHTYGGGFLYHLDNNRVAVGFVVGLDYQNPYLSPFEEFQRFKTHPAIRETFAGGRRIEYGARALVEGGFQSIPQLSFKGGALVGDAAGFMNMPRIKGIHTAMKSGLLAAEAVFPVLDNLEEVENVQSGKEAVQYRALFDQSWAHAELYAARNVRPSFERGLLFGVMYTGMEELFFKGRLPFTFKHHGKDHTKLKKAADCRPIEYPKPDGILTFDRMSSVFLANVAHEENQPVHLTLKQPQVMIDVNRQEYASPETRYCPAGVYEMVEEDGKPYLQINASNCVHCKTCDIKDPTQNIIWICPEGGSGPNYGTM